MAQPDTRERILLAAAELYRRQGMPATGLKQIAAAANAAFGSIYHHFPGGKEQISEEVISAEGVRYARLVGEQLSAATDPVDGIAGVFEAAGALLAATDYAEACSIETIALEVASTNDRLRAATAEVFEDWTVLLAHWFAGAGLADEDCRRLALAALGAMEGAFVLCRSLRSTEPMAAAGTAVLAAARATAGALHD
jgi:TetR/AcrR family transcriptional repressor of lmrAB and yxaGH operons